MFTEKEKQILNALLEEELNYVINNGDELDEIVSSYSRSLMTILMKMNTRTFGAIKTNRISTFMRGNFASRQLL